MADAPVTLDRDDEVFVLRMDAGENRFSPAVRAWFETSFCAPTEAQRRGYAEANPAMDVDGADAGLFRSTVQRLLGLLDDVIGGLAAAVLAILIAIVFANVVGRIVHTVGGDRVPVIVEPGARDAVVLVDVRRLERVLGNILDNARMWLRDYHADGLRLDMTPYMRRVNGTDGDEIPEGVDRHQISSARVRAVARRWVTIATTINPPMTPSRMNRYRSRRSNIAKIANRYEWGAKDTAIQKRIGLRLWRR